MLPIKDIYQNDKILWGYFVLICLFFVFFFVCVFYSVKLQQVKRLDFLQYPNSIILSCLSFATLSPFVVRDYDLCLLRWSDLSRCSFSRLSDLCRFCFARWCGLCCWCFALLCDFCRCCFVRWCDICRCCVARWWRDLCRCCFALFVIFVVAVLITDVIEIVAVPFDLPVLTYYYSVLFDCSAAWKGIKYIINKTYCTRNNCKKFHWGLQVQRNLCRQFVRKCNVFRK